MRLLPIILATTCAYAADTTGAASGSMYRILDAQPKTLVLVHSSHGGVQQLQQVLTKAGYPHVKAVGFFGGGSIVDATTGTINEKKLQGWVRAMVPKTPDAHVVAILQTDFLNVGLRKQGIDGARDAKVQDLPPSPIDEAAEFALMRNWIKAKGAKEMFWIGYHYHPSVWSPIIFRRKMPFPLPESFDQPEPWLAQSAASLGRQLVFDGRHITAPYRGLHVGFDARHPAHTGLAHFARFDAFVAQLAKDEGATIKERYDLKAMADKEHKQRTLITEVSMSSRALKPGDTVTITWKADPSVKKVDICWFPSVPGEYPATLPIPDFTYPIAGEIADNLDGSSGSWTWTVPTHVKFMSRHKEQQIPNAGPSLRLAVTEHDENSDCNGTSSVFSFSLPFSVEGTAAEAGGEAPEP